MGEKGSRFTVDNEMTLESPAGASAKCGRTVGEKGTWVWIYGEQWNHFEDLVCATGNAKCARTVGE